jgi:uncharacterized membrane protein YeaQ/YmgE (transglycosylase-associated protein family)
MGRIDFLFPWSLILLERGHYMRNREPRPPRRGGKTVTVSGIISALIVGLIIGALGRLVVPGRQNIPIWLTMVIGVVAALIGTAIARAVGVAATRGLNWIELLIQVVLAAVGVGLVVGISGRRHTTV